MCRTPWAAYLWPGLPQLWRRGSWSALALAVGAAGLVNVALASSFVWSELLPGRVRTGAWLVVAAVWVGSAVFSRWGEARRTVRQERSQVDDGYPEATEHYLRGDWFEAECRLRELLRREPRDLEAGLMLATLLRHTSRFEEAAQQLDRLQRLDGWERWAMEIGRERACLAGAREAEAEEPAEGHGEGPEESLRREDSTQEDSTQSDSTQSDSPQSDSPQSDSPQSDSAQAPEGSEGLAEKRIAGSQGLPGDRAHAA